MGKFKDGYYTDSNPSTQGYDFWCNGIYAKFDSDENGSHEIIFKVRDKKLVYVGILGAYNIFTCASDNYKMLIGKTVDNFIEMCTPQETDGKSSDLKAIKDGKGNTTYQWTDEKGKLHNVTIEDEDPKK